MKRKLSLTCLLLSFTWLMGCQSANDFSFSLAAALASAAPDGEAINPCIIDNGDGTSSLDVNCDGTPETTIDPTSVPPPPATTDPSDPGIVRDGSGNCVMSTNFAYINVTTNTYTYTDLSGAEDLWIHLASQGNTATVNLNGVTGLKRIFIDHQGNANRVIIQNATLAYGICNEISGGSNSEFFQSSCSAPVADLLSGNGNNNKLDLDFQPSTGLRYALSGSSNCLSAPTGTAVLAGSGDTFNSDGTNCF